MSDYILDASPLVNQYVAKDVIKYVKKIVDSFDLSDNIQKATLIRNRFEEIGFKLMGTGTNRIVFLSPENSDIVFKVALDERGIEDNIAEYELCTAPILEPYVTATYEHMGLIAVSQRAYTMNSSEFNSNIQRIYQILSNIAGEFLLDDVGPKSFLNWGFVGQNIVINDYANLVPLTGVNLQCRSADCQGKIIYRPDYTGLECAHCKRQYTITELYVTRDISEEIFEGFNNAGVTPSANAGYSMDDFYGDASVTEDDEPGISDMGDEEFEAEMARRRKNYSTEDAEDEGSSELVEETPDEEIDEATKQKYMNQDSGVTMNTIHFPEGFSVDELASEETIQEDVVEESINVEPEQIVEDSYPSEPSTLADDTDNSVEESSDDDDDWFN